MRFADLDAITVDANGTLVELRDPTPALRQALADRGVARDEAIVRRAFEAEMAFYVPRTATGRDAESLQRLRIDCALVFLAAAQADLEPESFVEAYIAGLVFEPAADAVEALRGWRARGLAVAVVSNWDVSLDEQLERLGLAAHVDAVVTSAGAGVEKPDPAIFHAALEQLGVLPGRALHIGDGAGDEEGARAVGMHFRWAPVATALDGVAA